MRVNPSDHSTLLHRATVCNKLAYYRSRCLQHSYRQHTEIFNRALNEHSIKEMDRSSLVLLPLLLALGACQANDVLQFERQSDVVCPGDTAVCGGPSSTCCRSQSGEWSCCPFKDGQCCSDGAHCCPSGTVCDAGRSACLPLTNNTTEHAVSWPAVRRSQQVESESQSSSSVKVGILCPDRKSQCRAYGSACCRDPIGRFSCCTYPTNVCCDDGLHCCHSGTVCDGLANRCIPYAASNSVSWTSTVNAATAVSNGGEPSQPAQKAVPIVNQEATNTDLNDLIKSPAGVNRICPDGGICLGTCCLMTTFPLRYSCCAPAFPNCCVGGRFCCAAGYTCIGQRCIRSI